jgi:5'-nucleotidase (lipoprotein e(P4) family)
MVKHRESATVFVAALASLAIVACAPPSTVAPAPAPAAVQSHDVHWARGAAEHRAVYLATYRNAADRLAELSRGRAPGSWGVILDADETVIDNSEYEVRRVPFGGTFDAAGWSAWVAEGRAPALPGAVAFTARVHELGGKVVIVTNRNDAECPITRSNLQHVAITTDLVLCKTATDDKNPRFDSVQNGSASPGFPAITVLEWVGDNIQDFPHMTQAVQNEPDSAFSRFGRVFFVLPNPMYGSWQSNPFK